MTDGAPAVATSPAPTWDMGVEAQPPVGAPPKKEKRERRADRAPAREMAAARKEHDAEGPDCDCPNAPTAHLSSCFHVRAPAPQTSAPAPDGAPDLRRIPLDRIVESKLNPRQRYHGLEELAESLKTGQLTPCLVRPTGPGVGYFELAAGHRRFRAAKLAGLSALDCVVRAMDDRRFLEVLVIENDQREDVHPLEEAQGYRQLMESAGYDVPAIAARVGRSVKYVYDRMKLLQLTPEARKLFLDGRFEAGHAILLARLTPKQQAAALDPQHGGLFAVEDAGEVDEDGRPVDRGGQRRFGALVDGGRGHKSASVREFATWINDRVRLTESAIADPVLFPEQAAQLEEATEQKLKVIHISVDHQLHPDARLEGVRTYGPMSWEYADGQEHRPRHGGRAKLAKTCAHAVIGLVVAGEGRGGMFQVCIAKEKCPLHWPEQYKRAQERKAAAAAPAKATGTKGAKAAPPKAPTEQPWQRQDRERREAHARWRKVVPAVREAMVARVKVAPLASLGDILIEDLGVRAKASPVPRGKSAEDLVRHLVHGVLEAELGDTYTDGSQFRARHAKQLGLDLKPILAKAEADAKGGVKEVARFKGAKKGKKAK